MRLSRRASEAVADITENDGTVNCGRLKKRIYSLDHASETGLSDELNDWANNQGHGFGIGDRCEW